MAYDLARYKELDLSDSIIDATFQKEDLTNQKLFKNRMRQAIEKAEERLEENPQFIEQVKQKNPSIADALAALNPKLKSINSFQHE